MRYESIPRKVMNGLTGIYKYLKEEFGNWAFVLIGVALLLLYKPVMKLFDMFSMFVLYGVLIAIGLGVLYWILKKLFR